MKRNISLFIIIFALQTVLYLTAEAKTIDCKTNENYQMWEKSKQAKNLQICLNKNGYRLQIDSIYGKKTDNAKKAYIKEFLPTKQKIKTSPIVRDSKDKIQLPSSKKIIKFLFFVFIFIIFIFSGNSTGRSFSKTNFHQNKTLTSIKFGEKNYYPDNCKAWSLRNGSHDVRDLPDYDRRN